jgi:hypothetical protein
MQATSEHVAMQLQAALRIEMQYFQADRAP